jgi:hypothetical protein
VTVPGDEGGESLQMSYSAATGIYEGRISFSAATLGMGRVHALGAVGNQVLQIQSAYRLQQVVNSRRYIARCISS